MKKIHHSQHTSSSSSLSHYDQLHRKNRYYQNPPNLYLLAQEFPQIIGQYIECNHQLKKGKLDWKNAEAVRIFTQLLLFKDFQLQITFPTGGYLCPPIPNRLNYICWLSDLLDSTASLYSQPRPRIIDIGTGSSLIYPLLGVKSFGWEFIGTDISREALTIAQSNLEQNPSIREFIQLLLLQPADLLQKLLKEYYLPSITSRQQPAAPGSEGEAGYSKPVIPLLDLVKQAMNQTITTSQQNHGEVLAQYRGQIRHTFQSLEERFQYRLSDCEHTFISTSTAASTMNEHAREERESHKRKNKKSRRGEYSMDEDDDSDEDNDDDNDNRSMETNSTNKSSGIVISNRRQPLASAVMTNPPFYDLSEQVMENEETVCTGNDIEMKTEGGEIGFITAMIADSLILKESVIWYTAMVGRKSSIGVLKSILQHEGVPKQHIFTTVFAQGVTYRWGLAWTFIPEAAALYMSYQLLQGNIDTNTMNSDHPSTTSMLSSQRKEEEEKNAFALSLTQNEFHQTMTGQEKSILDRIVQSASFDAVNDEDGGTQSKIQQPPSVLLLEEGKKRLAMILFALDDALTSINLSKFPEIHYLAAPSGQRNIGAIQSTMTHFSSNFIIQESNLHQQYYLFFVEIFASSQPSSTAVMASSPVKKLLVTFHLHLSSSPENTGQSTLMLQVKLSSIFSSQKLASMLLHRMKEHIENEYLRNNRRWRRTLQADQRC